MILAVSSPRTSGRNGRQTTLPSFVGLGQSSRSRCVSGGRRQTFSPDKPVQVWYASMRMNLYAQSVQCQVFLTACIWFLCFSKTGWYKQQDDFCVRCRHLAKHPEAAWNEVPNLPRTAIKLLDENFHHLTSTVLHCQTSCSADTTKLLLKLQNGMQVEAVIMHYDTTGICIACLNVKID